MNERESEIYEYLKNNLSISIEKKDSYPDEDGERESYSLIISLSLPGPNGMDEVICKDRIWI